MNTTLDTAEMILHFGLLKLSRSVLISRLDMTFRTVLGVVNMVKQKRVVTSSKLKHKTRYKVVTEGPRTDLSCLEASLLL